MLNLSNTIGIGGFQEAQNRALLNNLKFITGESLQVGQIVDQYANSFQVIQGDEDFAIDSSGNITFKSLPDYDIKRTYKLKVRSSANRIYTIAVYVTIFIQGYTFNGTETFYSDTYFAA